MCSARHAAPCVCSTTGRTRFQPQMVITLCHETRKMERAAESLSLRCCATPSPPVNPPQPPGFVAPWSCAGKERRQGKKCSVQLLGIALKDYP